MTDKSQTDKTDPAQASDAAEHGAPADVREQFRAALERKKNAGAGGGKGGAGPSGDKASDATANQKRQREFRRKSGG